jgi:hypothetical protein
MKHLRAANRKAHRIDEIVTSRRKDVVALQNPSTPPQQPHIPTGCAVATKDWRNLDIVFP